MRASPCFLYLSAAALLFVAGCGERQYAKGSYINPNQVILRSDKFVEADLQQIADKLSQDLTNAPELAGQPLPITAMMSLLVNDTDEHIDMRSLSDKLRTKLFQSKKFRFVNANLRSAVQEEVNYQSTDWVDPSTATRRGKQVGAKYLISGALSSIKQPVGRQEIVYYKMTLELTDLSTNLIVWTDDLEIKKQFRKRYVGS